jgi:hypothetical protein
MFMACLNFKVFLILSLWLQTKFSIFEGEKVLLEKRSPFMSTLHTFCGPSDNFLKRSLNAFLVETFFMPPHIFKSLITF